MLLFAASALVGAAASGLAIRYAGSRRQSVQERINPPVEAARTVSARRNRQAAEVLAISVLLDSAIEHFRGNYENRLMYLAPAAAALTLATDFDNRRRSEPRVAGGASAIGIGLTGFFGHFYNLMKRPGGFSWHNLFYAAPIGAPGSLILSGAFSLLAEQATGRRLRWTNVTEGQVQAILTAGGIVGTLGEVALLHFRGAFQNRAMYIPIVVMPLAAGSLVLAAVAPRPCTVALSRVLLRSSGLAGLVGAGFHVYGLSRNMGGWSNWSQNLFVAPPIPAPLGFSGITLAGLGALELLSSGTHR